MIPTLSPIHQRYAEEIIALAGLRSPALRRALAQVRREEFLKPGPWTLESLDGLYYESDDDNITHVLHGVAVALDPARGLNNGNPASIMPQLEKLNIGPGETVVHVGAGTGYYTALIAELVGPQGRVIASEIDPALCEEARSRLQAWPQVTVTGDVFAADLPPLDVVFSSAGLSHVPKAWLAALRPNGRILMPLTGSFSQGAVFLFRKLSEDGPLSASVHAFTRHYPCAGARGKETLLALDAAFRQPVSGVKSLRTTPPLSAEECWLAGDGYYLCMTPPD